MANTKRRYRLLDSKSRDTVDLRDFERMIIDTINATVSGKNPVVLKDCFIIDQISHFEAVLLGRALSKIPELSDFGKTIVTFRLFDGKNVNDSPVIARSADTKKKPLKGGRLK